MRELHPSRRWWRSSIETINGDGESGSPSNDSTTQAICSCGWCQWSDGLWDDVAGPACPRHRRSAVPRSPTPPTRPALDSPTSKRWPTCASCAGSRTSWTTCGRRNRRSDCSTWRTRHVGRSAWIGGRPPGGKNDWRRLWQHPRPPPRIGTFLIYNVFIIIMILNCDTTWMLIKVCIMLA